LYPSVYGVTCLNIGAQVLPPKGYAEGYYNNTCVLPDAGSPYLNIGAIAGGSPCLSGTAAADAAFRDGLILGNNTVYVPGGSAVVECGGSKLTSAKFASLGLDEGTQFIATRPSNDTMVAWMRDMLAM